jgi:N-acetylmuramoyl-L-alanine amidase
MKLLPLLFSLAISAYSFELTLDVGHTPTKFGSLSSSCKKEYDYNLALAKHITNYLNSKNIRPLLSYGEISFDERYASSNKKDLFLSIHHDSMQEQFIKRDKNNCPSSNYASGFSIFVSQKNPHYAKSLQYAKALGTSLIKQGYKPSYHHAENIAGENRILLDKKLGIYIFDDLKVLKNVKSPALLLEAGVTVNPIDEQRVQTLKFKNNVSSAILKAME